MVPKSPLLALAPLTAYSLLNNGQFLANFIKWFPNIATFCTVNGGTGPFKITIKNRKEPAKFLLALLCKELEYTKKLLQSKHEEDLELMMAIKKQL